MCRSSIGASGALSDSARTTLIFLPVSGVIDWHRSMSASRLSPSGATKNVFSILRHITLDIVNQGHESRVITQRIDKWIDDDLADTRIADVTRFQQRVH